MEMEELASYDQSHLLRGNAWCPKDSRTWSDQGG